MRAIRVLEFLVPILYVEKPTQVIITIGNTIFGALSRKRKVDWALVMRDVVKRLLAWVGKSKPNPICLHVFHLYYHAKMLKSEEKKAYKIGEVMAKHNVDLDRELKLTEEEDSKQGSLSSEEISALEMLNKSPTS